MENLTMAEVTRTDFWIKNEERRRKQMSIACVKQSREDDNKRIAERRDKKFQIKNRKVKYIRVR